MAMTDSEQTISEFNLCGIFQLSPLTILTTKNRNNASKHLFMEVIQLIVYPLIQM